LIKKTKWAQNMFYPIIITINDALKLLKFSLL
jgi:hypothetical protein